MASGAQVNFRDPYNKTALWWASLLGHTGNFLPHYFIILLFTFLYLSLFFESYQYCDNMFLEIRLLLISRNQEFLLLSHKYALLEFELRRIIFVFRKTVYFFKATITGNNFSIYTKFMGNLVIFLMALLSILFFCTYRIRSLGLPAFFHY